MVPSVKVQVEADHCCNWRCCWGCREVEVEPPRPPVRDESGSAAVVTTTEKTVTVYHRHRREGEI